MGALSLDGAVRHVGGIPPMAALAGAVSQALTKYPAKVARYRGGEEKVFGWLMGQVMRETKGKGNPAVVKQLLARALVG